MAQPQISWLRYDRRKKGDASIGAEGFHYLSKAKWAAVTVFDLGIWCRIKGGNDISNQGC